MPYDFRNVTVPLGQLLFRKRNERWRNEAEDADTQRRVAAENELINRRADATQRVGLAQLEAAKRFEEQEREKNRAELESAFTQDYLASLPSDDPAAAAQAVAKARLHARALTVPQGYNVLENETRRRIAEATARVRAAEEETARLNAAVQGERNWLEAVKEFGGDKYVPNPARMTGQPGRVPLFVDKDEILAAEAAKLAQKKAASSEPSILDRLMQRLTGTEAISTNPNATTIPFPAHLRK